MPSFDRPDEPAIPPSSWMVRFAHLIATGAKVLDLAAGHGRHTRYFADRGCKVTAVDVDATDLQAFEQNKNVTVIEKDLESGEWLFERAAFDAIVVANYLHRPLFPFIRDSLKDDGVLLYETFGRGNEQFGRPRNPDFLLAPGELLDAFSQSLTIVAYEHGVETVPRAAVRQRLCAQRIKSSVALPPQLSSS